jgi:hypothetical protein
MRFCLKKKKKKPKPKPKKPTNKQNQGDRQNSLPKTIQCRNGLLVQNSDLISILDSFLFLLSRCTATSLVTIREVTCTLT